MLAHLDQGPAAAVGALLEHLRATLDAGQVAWLPEGGAGPASGDRPVGPLERRAPDQRQPPSAAEPPGVHVVAPVTVDGVLRGTVVVTSGGRRVHGPAGEAEVTAVARCVGVVVRGARLRQQQHDWQRRRDEAHDAVQVADGQLLEASVRERRRLAATIMVTVTREVEHLVEACERLEDAATPGALAAVRAGVERVVAQVRATVDGVNPARLRRAGPVPALLDVAAGLGLSLAAVGDVGHRASWEVESGVFWGVSAVLGALGDTARGTPVLLRWSGAGGRTTADVQLDAADPVLAAARRSVGASLAEQDERLRALGGGSSVVVHGHTLLVTCWLPDDLGRADRSP